MPALDAPHTDGPTRPQFRHLHGAQEPTGDEGLDFLSRLALAEERDIHHASPVPSLPSSPPQRSPPPTHATQQQQPRRRASPPAGTPPAPPRANDSGGKAAAAPPSSSQKQQQQQQQGKRSALKPPVAARVRSGQKRTRKLTFHRDVVTRVEAAVQGLDRRVIPCLASSGISPYSDAEDRFYGTKMFIKTFRQHEGGGDPAVRRMFNEAAAAEAQLRGAQLRESVDLERDESERPALGGDAERAATSLENKHYAQHLALMQRANMRYQMQKHRKAQRRRTPSEAPEPDLSSSLLPLTEPKAQAEEHAPFVLRETEVY